MKILFPDSPSRNTGILLIVFFCIYLWGCGQSAGPGAKKDASLLPDDNRILAYVNQSPISGYDLEQSVVETVGRNVAAKLDTETRHTILKGLVSRRAIAQIQEKELGEIERKALEKQLQIYKENLLVKLYLAKNNLLGQIGEGQIKAYYQAHAAQFGAKQLLRYEMVVAKDAMGSGKKREKIMLALKDAGKKSSWSKWVEDLKKRGLAAEYRAGHGSAKLLEPELGKLLDTMGLHETSPIHFIKGDACILRITEKKQTPPRPLDEVRTQIREILRPMLYRQAIRKVSQQVLEQSDIQYTKEI